LNISLFNSGTLHQENKTLVKDDANNPVDKIINSQIDEYHDNAKALQSSEYFLAYIKYSDASCSLFCRPYATAILTKRRYLVLLGISSKLP
jgi:hypothetical protein